MHGTSRHAKRACCFVNRQALDYVQFESLKRPAVVVLTARRVQGPLETLLFPDVFPRLLHSDVFRVNLIQ
jgi:hypothetical protein